MSTGAPIRLSTQRVRERVDSLCWALQRQQAMPRGTAVQRRGVP